MDNKKGDNYYIEKILEDLKLIVQRMDGIDNEEFSRNDVLQDSLMFRLVQISENTKKLSDEYKEENPLIPWTAIYGLRNRIVHDYGNIDLSVVIETLRKDIPELLAEIEKSVEDRRI